jgi:hypothetical protein
VLSGQIENGPAAADLEIVAVGADAQDMIEASPLVRERQPDH